MIAPRSIALAWAATLWFPAGMLAAARPDYILWWILPGALGALAALVDAVRLLDRPLPVRASLPPLTRLTKRRRGALCIHLERSAPFAGPLRLGLALPEELGSEVTDMTVDLPPDAVRCTVEWPITPRARGRHVLRALYAEAVSPWRLWRRRTVHPAEAEIRVYPNLLAERTRLAAQFLNRPAAGLHAQRQVGKGREFERLREYVYGDGYEDLHWKASARRGRPITKVYQLERTQEIYVAVDASRLSARRTAEDGPGGDRVIERYITAALTLGVVAERQGDHFGLCTFSDRPHGFLRAGAGPGHFHACREVIYALEPRHVNPDFAELFTFLRLRLRRRALVVIITDLSDPVVAESFVDHVGLLTERHRVLAAHVTAPEVQPFFTGAGIARADDIYDRLAGHLQWHDLHERVRALAHRGVTLRLTREAALAPALIEQYMAVKRRQLL